MFHRNVCSLTLALSFWLASPAYAEDGDYLYSLPLSELLQITVVSTSSFEESLYSSSNSVTRTDTTRWLELGVRNMGELLNHMPSTVAPQGVGKSRTMATRGYYRVSSTRGTAVRFDGVPMNKLREGTGLMEIDGYDLATLDSVEVIRGPGSAVHGNDAFHGVVSMQSIAPTEDQLTVKTERGTHRTWASSLVGHNNLDDHAMTVALAFRDLGDADLDYKYDDNILNSQLRGNRSHAVTNKNLLLKYRYSQGPNQLSLTGYYLDLDTDQLPGVGLIGGLNLQGDKDWSFYNSETGLVKIAWDRKIGSSGALQLHTYAWTNRDYFRRDPSLIIGQESWRKERGTGGLVLYKHEFDSNTNLAVGYEYRNNEILDFVNSIQAVSGETNIYKQEMPGADEYREVHSLIVNGHVDVASKLTASYGIRADHYSEFDTQYSPHLGLIGEINSHSQLKLLYGHAFRAPALFESLGGDRVTMNNFLQPEELDSIELIYQWRDNHIIHTFTLFKNSWDEAIDIRVDGESTDDLSARFENVGRSDAKGIEWTSTARWTQFRMDANASYVRSENKVTDQEDRAFPHWMIQAGAGYEIDSAWDVYVNNRYHIRRDAVVSNDSKPARDYFRTDVVLTWMASAGLKVALKVGNLFDRDNYFPSSLSHRDGIPDYDRYVSLSVNWNAL